MGKGDARPARRPQVADAATASYGKKNFAPAGPEGSS